jgi:hypothetical protein
MEQIPAGEVERTMKVQEVILRAMAKKITWWQAAEILGISERSMRRWKFGYQKHGFRALLDKRKGKPSWKKAPIAELEKVLSLYREQYYDFNVRHFHEKAGRETRHSPQLHMGQECASGRRSYPANVESVAAPQEDGPADPCRACCCTLMAAIINGSATVDGTTCW